MSNRNRINLFFVFLSTLGSVLVMAQEATKRFEFENIKDGISKVAVSTIIQDQNGFIWMGTNGEGLYKFDGIDYTSYKHRINDSTSLNSSLIHCTYLDTKNRLWIGTENGLNLYDRDLDKFVRIPFERNNKSGIYNFSAFTIYGDASDNIFIGSFENGYFRLAAGDSIIRRVASNFASSRNIVNVNDIKVSGEGKIYAGTSLGLEEYHKEDNKFKFSYFNTDKGLVTFKHQVQSILLAHDSSIWIGTVSQGVYKIEKGIEKGGLDAISHYDITDKRILDMVQLADGTVLVGTENDGLFHMGVNGNLINRYVQDKTDKKSISSNSIWALLLDTDNRIWVGYYNSGISVYDSLYDKFKGLESLPYKTNSLDVGSVTGILMGDDRKLWISMDGGGIDTYDPTTNRFEHIGRGKSRYSGLKSSDIQTIFFDSHKNLWVGSWQNGLFLLKEGSYSFTNFSSKNLPDVFNSNRIMSFAEGADGTIWIGTFYDGLISYNPKTQEFIRHTSEPFVQNEIHTSAIRKVLVDTKNNLWLGTTQGLFKVTQERSGGFVVKSLAEKVHNTSQNKTSANHILSLYESKDGKILIGTRGSGLCSYDDETNEYVFYNEIIGLNDETVSSVLESDNDNIWISGNSGITKINLSQGEFTNYTQNDGLLSDDFNFNAVLQDDQGILYFGNYKGIDFFDPNEISQNKGVPRLYLTGFKLFNEGVVANGEGSPLKKVISETKEITLDHTQSVFTIDYVGINYTRPEKNQYAYYLEGLEDSWNYVGSQRSATYTNLDQGEYTFKLKSANNDGIWNETPLELKITVLPPWWKTNIALLCYLCLFMLGVYLLNLVTQKRIKEKQLIRAERDQRAREDELYKQKLQFFTNISHEFRTPLTLIINPLKDIIGDKTLNLPAKIRDKHNVIYKNTDRLYRLINELMDFRKLEHNKVNIKVKELDLSVLSNEVIDYFEAEALSKNIHLTIDKDQDHIPIYADEKMLEKIIFNILSNAMKVTNEGGGITLDIVSNDIFEKLPLVDENEPIKVVEIVISDTGPGLTEEQVGKIFERFYQVKNLNETYYGGTGIGLEVVQSFVQLHKGKIEVTSELGKGTSFRIVLPKGKEYFSENELLLEESKALRPSSRESFGVIDSEKGEMEGQEEKSPPKYKSYTLLIVEDNAELRNYLKDEFKEQYKVVVAKDGKEGLKIAKDILPDIILTDVIMPNMDGFMFCKFIKEDLRTSHIPLLMLTAKAKIDDRIEGIEFGADAYMVKPFDMRLLRLRLNQLITSRQIIFDKYFRNISGGDENTNNTSLDKGFIQKVLNYVHENISDPDLSVELLAKELNLSRSQLYRKIKTLTGQTVNEFLRNVRLQKAKQIIETDVEINISEVCYQVGFSSPSYFTKCFKALFGVLPTDVVRP
ncbi:response regulator [Maribacter polysiphoniae]|uniref:histidine kinase n=1 Tax=Maribacter polysiphoniae TaxID=429344 RepID=A0A316DW17_9FLAO|nr:two-component regulator propeller domain-containing protein [Maribacter polysiphoniae]MBD1261953.1 response regulator [Maribacter polysiphoniae]PWK22321.1 signal transduction histidine kinase [Maribacter polysiphoniae]